MAGKQAKTLSAAQMRTALSYLATTRNAERDVVMFLLSIRAGLRAKEIAQIEPTISPMSRFMSDEFLK